MKNLSQILAEFERYLNSNHVTYHTSDILEETILSLAEIKPDMASLKRFDEKDATTEASSIQFVFSGLNEEAVNLLKAFLGKFDKNVQVLQRNTTTAEFPARPTIARWAVEAPKDITVHDFTLSGRVFCEHVFPLVQKYIEDKLKNDDSSLWRYYLNSDIYLGLFKQRQVREEAESKMAMSSGPSH